MSHTVIAHDWTLVCYRRAEDGPLMPAVEEHHDTLAQALAQRPFALARYDRVDVALRRSALDVCAATGRASEALTELAYFLLNNEAHAEPVFLSSADVFDVPQRRLREVHQNARALGLPTPGTPLSTAHVHV